MRVSVCQLGSRMNYAVAKALQNEGLLSTLYTDICADKQPVKFISWVFSRLGFDFGQRLFQRRTNLPLTAIKHFPFFGFNYYFRKNKAIFTIADEFENYLWAEREFAKNIQKIWQKDYCTHLYLYNTCALSLIKKNQFSKVILEQCSLPIHHYLKRISSEEKKYPDWSNVITEKLLDEEVVLKYGEQEREELSKAHCVIAPSKAVIDAIQQEGIQIQSHRIIPYGYTFSTQNFPRSLNKKLRIGTVGTIELRKGIHHFYRIATLGIDADFVAIGGFGHSLPQEKQNLLTRKIKLTGHLNRKNLLSEFLNIDIMLFLTLGEGSATVIYEALNLGIPVVTTAEAGSIVEHGVSGFIVEAEDVESILNCINTLSDPTTYSKMSQEALLRSQYGSEAAYANRLVETLRGI